MDTFVEDVDFPKFVDGVSVFPGRLIPAVPLDVVLEFLVAAGEAGIEDFLDQVFFFAFDFDRRGGGMIWPGYRLSAARDSLETWKTGWYFMVGGRLGW